MHSEEVRPEQIELRDVIETLGDWHPVISKPLTGDGGVTIIVDSAIHPVRFFPVGSLVTRQLDVDDELLAKASDLAAVNGTTIKEALTVISEALQAETGEEEPSPEPVAVKQPERSRTVARFLQGLGKRKGTR